MTVCLPHCFDAGVIRIYYLHYACAANPNVTEKAKRSREMGREEGPKLIQCGITNRNGNGANMK